MENDSLRRPWQFYTTSSGRSPIKEFLLSLDVCDRASLAQELHAVAHQGLGQARHVRGRIWHVGAHGPDSPLQVIFGIVTHGLLAIEGFVGRSSLPPPDKIALAERRLHEWEQRRKEVALSGS